MSVYSDNARRLYAESEKTRDRNVRIPEGISIFADISYGSRGSHPQWQLLDVYRPDGDCGKKYPVILNIHGGGWVQGEKEGYRFYCMSFVRYGACVINFSYRLAPEYPFPAPLEDISQVLDWVHENREKYGFDTDRIYGIGDSAGGNILSLYAALDTNPVSAAEYPFMTADLHFRAIALNCAVFRIPPVSEMNRTMIYHMNDYVGTQITDDIVRKLNASEYMTSAFPPVFLMTSIKDTLRESPDHAINAFKKHGIRYEFRIWGTAEHPLGHVFHLDTLKPESLECSREEFEFFAKVGEQNE